MVRRVSRSEAARLLDVSISTIDRRIQRSEFSIEKEEYGPTRERIWVLLDDDALASSSEDSPMTAGATAWDSPDGTTADYVKQLEHQMQSLQQIADFRQEQLKQSEWRLGQVLDNLTTAQQTIERMSRALPAATKSASPSKKPWSWWPWRKNG